MGTSGAYGGSGASVWKTVHDLYEQGADGPTIPAAELAQAVAAALRRTNRHGPHSPGAFSAGRLGPSRPASSDGYAHSRTTGATAGGTSGLSRRAARGAAALAGAQAYRDRDRQALADLGLDLDTLDALPNDRARCAAVADALLGAPAHPDDAAMKVAYTQTMIEALKSPEPLDSERLVEMFIENLTYEQVVVELTSEHRKSAVSPAQAAKIEKQMKKFIRTSVRKDTVSKTGRRLDMQALVDRATSLVAKVLRIFGRSQ